MLDLFEFQRDRTNDNILSSSGRFKTISASTRAVEKMMQNGVLIDTRIFDNDFVVTKNMVLELLGDFHPTRMCGWQEHYMAEIIQHSYKDGKNIVERWSNLQHG